MTASSTTPAPSPGPVASATRRVRPATIGVPASVATPSTTAGATAPLSARQRASRIPYVGDGSATTATSTARSSSERLTVWVNASTCVLSTHPSMTRS